MFFVAKRDNNKFGVIDIEDGKIDFYTPEQLRDLVISGLDIQGVTCNLDFIKVEVLTPVKFDIIDAGVFSVNKDSSSKDDDTLKVFNKMIGKYDLCTLFDKSELNGYLSGSRKRRLLLELKDVDKLTGDLYFGFVYDYSVGSNLYISEDELYGAIESSPFNDLIEIVQDTSNIPIRTARFKYTISNSDLHTLALSCKELFTKTKIVDLLRNESVVNKFGFCIEYRDGEHGYDLAPEIVSIYYEVEGIKLPIIIDARLDFVQNEDASDSEIYYKKLRYLYN